MPLVKTGTTLFSVSDIPPSSRAGASVIADATQATQIAVRVSIVFGSGTPQPVTLEVYASPDGVAVDTVPYLQVDIDKQTGEAVTTVTVPVPAALMYVTAKVYNKDGSTATGAVSAVAYIQEAT